jgi:ubiquinone/menaquinone biosynthesis C-methylase UbiE
MSWENVWESVFTQQSWGKYPDMSIVRFIARRFFKETDRKSIKVLEVGCGPGANVWFLAREGLDAYGMDGSSTAIAQAGERLSSEGLQATLMVADATCLPYDAGTFDAVIDCECVYANDVDSSKKILSEVNRVLKPGGEFFSLSFTDEMYVGKTRDELAPRVYTDISDGLLAGKGLVRLMNKEDIQTLYGEYFCVDTVDKTTRTDLGQQYLTSEWMIVCSKKGDQ